MIGETTLMGTGLYGIFKTCLRAGVTIFNVYQLCITNVIPIVRLHLRSAVLVTKDKVWQVYVHIAPAAKVSAKVKGDHNMQLHSEMRQRMELHRGPLSLSAVSFFTGTQYPASSIVWSC